MMMIMIHGVTFGVAAFFLLLTVVRSQDNCSKTCIAKNCTNMNVRYGKYCGIGYFGCRGEPPCDALDVCCLTHDVCVGLHGMTNVNCHREFKRCVNEISKSIKESKEKPVGFSPQCPYSIVIPTVFHGMNYGIFFSKIGNILKPLVPGSVKENKGDTKDGHGTKQGSKISGLLN